MSHVAVSSGVSGLAPLARTNAGGDVASRMAFALAWTAVGALVLLSGMALIGLGIPYASAGGSPLSKIHPATWLAAAAIGALALGRVGPGRRIAATTIASPGVAIFVVAVAILLVQVGIVLRLPLASVTDTFVLPIFLFVLIGAFETDRRRAMGGALHVALAANALLGLVEYASGWRLTPMVDFDGTAIVDWRSTALFGHPLNNAVATGLWLVMLASGAGRDWRPVVRLAAMALATAALVAFGGRVAMVLALLVVAAIAGLGGLRLLAGRRFDVLDAAAAVAAATALVVVGVVAVDAGAADRLIERFADDSGSAGTRIAMFRIFGDLTWEEFLFGPPNDLVLQAQREHGIAIGIESTEVALVAFYGLFVALVVLAGLAAFLGELVRVTSAATWWPVVYFAVVMSGSTGLSSKSTNLALFTVMVLTLMPRGAVRRSTEPERAR